jgi:hypothetical protein
MAACCLTSITTIEVAGQPNVGVQVQPIELLQFISRDFLPMNEMCERAQMSEMEIYERSKRVFDYFGFRFDAPPPPD